MKRLVAMAVILGAGLLGACSKQSSSTTDEILMYPVVVGEKTELYEVLTPNELKLAPGVKFQVVPGPGGNNNAIVFQKPNGDIGGYMACDCPDGTMNNCKISSDNPNHNP